VEIYELIGHMVASATAQGPLRETVPGQKIILQKTHTTYLYLVKKAKG